MNKLIKITWIDSETIDNCWLSEEDLPELKLQLITTVGYIVQENKDLIRVAGSITKDKLYCSIMTIPKKVITNKEII